MTESEEYATLIVSIHTPMASTLGMPNVATATYNLCLDRIIKQAIKNNKKRGEKDKREGKCDRFNQTWLGGVYTTEIHGPTKIQQKDYEFLKIKENLEKHADGLLNIGGSGIDRVFRGTRIRLRQYLIDHYQVELIVDKEAKNA